MIRIILLSLFASLMARADATLINEAHRRFERANRLYGEGRYTDALQQFQAAYDLVPSVDILYNLGLAREKTFDYEGCALAFARYLSGGGADERRVQATQRLEQCRARSQIPVKISSIPPSAAIWIGEGERRTLRGRTPARLDLPPGHYQLSVDAPGYLGQSQELVVEEGVHPDIDFQLEKLSSLRIEADVAGARVKIDGALEGETPLTRERRAGTYLVEVEKSGYRSARREVKVESGAQVSLVMTLPPLPREGRIAVTGPTGAQLALDGDPPAPLPLSRAALAGPHHLEASAPGHRSFTGDVLLPAERDLVLHVRLTPERSRANRAIFGALLGGAGAALVVGAALGIVALDDQQRFDARPSLALRDTTLGHAHGADASFGVAGGLALAGLIYYLATIPRRSTVETVR